MTRRRPRPLLVLAIVALAPALAMFAVWRLAESRIPRGQRPASSTATPPSTTRTPLLSVRRLPAVLARDVSLVQLQQTVQPLLGTLGATDCVAVAVDGKPVAAAHETTPVRPASTLKLFVAAVALDQLGADFRYTTEVRGTLGPDGVVDGDLWLVGGGDPLLTSAWWKGPSAYPPFNTTSIESLATSVAAAGVHSVTGRLVGDASRYDDEWYAPGWAPDVRFTEAGPISALLANDSRRSPTESSNDPTEGAAQVLADELAKVGVTVTGGASTGTAPAGAPVIASVRSAPLSAIVQEMLTTSDNNTAEMLLKELGRQRGAGGTRQAGLDVVVRTLRDWQVPMTGVTMQDASGLSPADTTTCAAMLAVLARQRSGGPLWSALPVAGAKGGTLADAFTQAPLGGVLRAKTGTLEEGGVKALAGYRPVDGGGDAQFVLILNGPTAADRTEYLPRWEALGSALAGYPAGPTPAELAP